MTFKNWTEYFKRNGNHYRHFHWEENDPLNQQEIQLIADSLRKFQRGENSEGKHLFSRAKYWDNEDYTEAIKHFIKEEQQHAKILGEFMRRHGISKLSKGDWVDGVFRFIRNLAGLELSITVLVTAEYIAAVYYDALRKATPSVNLKHICNRILEDEEMHINFQAFALRHFHAGRPWLFNKAVSYAHWTLMLGTSLVVWVYHGQIFRAGGYTFSQYQKDLWREYFRGERMIAGQQQIVIKSLPWAVV